MAYADQPQMTTSKLVSIVIVILIHVFLGYALVTGLAYEAVKKAAERLEVIEVEEEQPEPEEEPPPPEDVPVETPPPVVSPPPIVRTPSPPPPIQTVQTPPPVAPVIVTPAPPVVAPPAPTPPPPAVSKARAVRSKGESGWARRIQENYPSRAQAEGRGGRVTARLSIGPDGRVTACTVSGSSGHSDLDSAACTGLTRYARFDPALNDAGEPIASSITKAIRYDPPAD